MGQLPLPVAGRESRNTAGAHSARILIADDETSVRDFLDQVLRWAGYWTARALDGQDALEMANQLAPFDLLLTDELMPRMRGHELARQLYQRKPNLKVLYLTGCSDQLFEDNGPLAGHEALLNKPATPDAILDAIARLLSEGANP